MFRTAQSRLLLTILVLFIHENASQAASVQVLADDTPIVVRGRIGDDSSFVKRIAWLRQHPFLN